MSALIVPYNGFTFLPHQESGVKWMISKETICDDDGCGQIRGNGCLGGILADDMGLGKTWQTIGLIMNNLVAKTLIVAPPVLISQWQDALMKSGLSVSLFWDKKWKGSCDAAVYLITYDKIWRNIPFVSGFTWDRIVLDEGHYIRNAKTKRASSLITLKSIRKWILSGTPVQNGLSDFRTLLSWLGHTVPHKNAMPACQELATTLVLRRPITLLADVMPPPPVHGKRPLSYGTGQEGTMFGGLVGRLNYAMLNRFPTSCILELYLRIQMFISHPQIYLDSMDRKYGGTLFKTSWEGTTTKLTAFNDMLKVDSVTPTLVFCNFKQEMDYVAGVAKTHGYNVYFIRGGMGAVARKRSMLDSTKLCAEGRPVLMICQIVAGNCGLNLQHLTRVIFYTQHWNPSVMDQAMARSYRYGQQKEVTVHHLVIGSPELYNIDRCMLAKHLLKRGLIISLNPALAFAFCPKFTVPSEEEILKPIDFKRVK